VISVQGIVLPRNSLNPKELQAAGITQSFLGLGLVAIEQRPGGGPAQMPTLPKA
jgi:hypothetical protein